MLDELERVNIKLTNSDIVFLKKYNKNLSEAMRIAIKKLRTQKIRETIVENIQIITGGIIILGISSVLPTDSTGGIIFMGIGSLLSIFGIFNLSVLVLKIKKRGIKNDV